MKASKHSTKSILSRSAWPHVHACTHIHTHIHQCYISNHISDWFESHFKRSNRLHSVPPQGTIITQPWCEQTFRVLPPWKAFVSVESKTWLIPNFFLPTLCHFKQRPGRFHPSKCFPVKCLLGIPASGSRDSLIDSFPAGNSSQRFILGKASGQLNWRKTCSVNTS